MSELTPKQAADVIMYYHSGENHKYRQRGWRDKIAIGQSAIHATLNRHSILPTGEALLTNVEMTSGMDYLDRPKDEPEITPAQEAEIERLVDTGQFSYDDARKWVMGD